MPRATNAPASRRRRKSRLQQARGFRGSRSKLYRQAAGAVDRAMALATIHRKLKKRDYRGLWIVRLSAACREAGKIAIEGKEYVVQDGDIMHFRFNV